MREQKPFDQGIREAHDSIAASYGGYRPGVGGEVDPIISRLYARLWAAAGLEGLRPRLLDAGCGNGNFFQLFRWLGVGELVGVDFSPRMLSVAHGRDPEARLIQSDVRAQPLKSGSIDLVHCYGVIEHLEALPPILGEFQRVLKPGGKLLLDVPVKGSMAYFSHLLLGIPPSRWGTRHRLRDLLRYREKMHFYRFYDIAEVLGMARSHGFTLVASLSTRYFHLHGPGQALLRRIDPQRVPRLTASLEQLARELFGRPSGYLLLLEKPRAGTTQ